MKKSSLKKQIEGWVWALVVALFLRYFVLQAYRIPSGSMEDTLLPGDFLLVFKPIYGIEIPYTEIKFFQFYKPKRGDIVIFRFPLDPSKDFVKRCVGLPGDTIEIKDKVLYINGKKVFEPYAIHKDGKIIPPLINTKDEFSKKEFQRMWMERELVEEPMARDNFGPVVVPPKTYFVLGDNRDNSSDSRFWGPVPEKYLKGVPLIIYFSWDSESNSIFKKIRIERLLQIPLLWKKEFYSVP
ncbi:MAG: signal peptidase I [candidate division WOR-3 bacterium]